MCAGRWYRLAQVDLIYLIPGLRAIPECKPSFETKCLVFVRQIRQLTGLNIRLFIIAGEQFPVAIAEPIHIKPANDFARPISDVSIIRNFGKTPKGR